MKTADEIKRKLFANPMFWVDKMVALEKALKDGTITDDDPNKGYVVQEMDEAKRKVQELLNAGKVTQEEVDAEIRFQESQ